MAEAGVFRGGSARLICEARGDEPLHLFDVFETLQQAQGPEANPRNGELFRHFGAVHGRLEEVRSLLAPYASVHFHPGVFPASAAELGAERFCFVHVDLDLEPSTRDALEFFLPRLLPGGILIGDNYDDPLVRRAFDAYFAAGGATVVELPWGQGMVVRGGG
jgi:O-methyltransferase